MIVMEPLIKNPMSSHIKHSSNDSGGKISWKPGGFRRFPWFGIIPLIFCISCTGIAIGVVLESNGGLEKNWSGLRQPGVLLAYTSTLANALMGLAFAQASVIFFWVQTTTPLPISSLHYNWAGSSSTMGAVKSIFQGKAIRVSLVSILVTVTSLLRGPLMQQASYVHVVDVLQNRTMDLPITLNISSLWGTKFGSLDMASWGPKGQFAPGFLDVVRDFINRAPIRMRGVDCENCTLIVEAFGFDVINCTELRNSSDTYDLDWPTYESQRLHPEQRKNIIFETSVRPVMDDNVTMIQITTRRKTDTECTGMLLRHTCSLNPGAVLYNLSLQEGIATLQSKSWKDDKFVKPIYAYMQDLDYPTVNTVFPLWQLGASLFNSTSWIQDAYDHSYSANYEGLVASLSAANGTTVEFGSPCYHYFNDPMDYIIDTYREIAFRMSVRAAAGPSNDYPAGESSSVQQRPDLTQKGIPYTIHSIQVQYAADGPALVLAVIVSLVGPVAILFLFWGWWKLGRDFSMSPLELANALLQQQQERRTSRSSGENEQLMDNVDESAGDAMAIQYETATDMTQMSCNSVSGSDIDQQHGQQLASVFADCSGNASADELATHFRQRGERKNSNEGNGNKDEEEEGEPIIQYGVVERGDGKYLGFAMVSGSQEAATAVRRPWKGELL